jgi:hypothetical protein
MVRRRVDAVVYIDGYFLFSFTVSETNANNVERSSLSPFWHGHMGARGVWCQIERPRGGLYSQIEPGHVHKATRGRAREVSHANASIDRGMF